LKNENSKILCKTVTKNGSNCRATAGGDGYCFWHSPSYAQKRKEASLKGGKNRRSVIRAEKLVPPRLVQVYNLLENALRQVCEKQMEPKQALAIASLSKAMVEVLTAGELEERMRRLEEGME
jgi:hypothetical protein